MSMDPSAPETPPEPAGSAAEPSSARKGESDRAPAAPAAPAAPGAAGAAAPAPETAPWPQVAAPTRVQQAPQPAAQQGRTGQPSFTPAQPSFTPAQPDGQPAQAAQAQPEAASFQGDQSHQTPQPGQAPFNQTVWPPQQSSQVSDPAREDFQQGNWPEQPPQYTPQPGWPQQQYGDMGGMPGPGGPGGQGGRLGYPVGRPPRRRRRGRRWFMALFTIIVLLILAVIGDRVANAIAENTMANQFVQNGFPVKPSVSIEGFPFLTQVAAHDIKKIDISATNVPAGPVTITSVKGTMTGVHLNSSFNGGTVDRIVGTVFVSFSSLADAGGGGTGTGITMTADGPDKVKITAGTGPLSDTEVAKVTQTGPNQISVQIQNGGSPLGGLLSSFGSFSFNIPKLPAGLKITGVSVTQQGITVTALGTHTHLTEPGS